MLSEQQQRTLDDYQQLYDELEKAHDTLPGTAVELRRQLRERRNEVSDILSNFAREDLLTNTVALEALAKDVVASNESLQQLQADLDKIAAFVKTAAEIVQTSNNALHAAEAFLKVV